MSNYFIGIDIGTQGARVVLLNEQGSQVAAKEEVFELTESSREEQSPLLWWETCKRLLGLLSREDVSLASVRAMAVTSTSGTIIPLDSDFNPLHPALMYSDPRSAEEAAWCKSIALQEVKQGYTAFNASSGLPKMRWYLNNYPEHSSRLYKFVHAADFITGRLCGSYETTDYTNAMKSGFDLHAYRWPDYISDLIGIENRWLQTVQASGAPLGSLLPELAAEWGLPLDVIVTTGMTDGCASQVASGAVSPGRWNTTLGTTMVIKGVTVQEIVDPSGAIYNHRHPAGFWMPGGASNTGADWVTKLFAGEDLQELGRKAGLQLPSDSLAWPLLQKGERFPFFAPDARGFWPKGEAVENFTSCMEGVAFVERYAYEQIARLSGEVVQQVYSAGGGSKNKTWLRIRSSVLNCPVSKMQNVSGAAGAAILAASQTFYASLQEAAAAMVHPELVVEPDAELVEPYEQKYARFIDLLKSEKIIQ
jgi:sugar (pentulose or hexulose) kinase